MIKLNNSIWLIHKFTKNGLREFCDNTQLQEIESRKTKRGKIFQTKKKRERVHFNFDFRKNSQWLSNSTDSVIY